MASAQVTETQLEELPIETRSVKALQLQHLKRSFDLFAGNYGSKPDIDTRRSVRQADMLQHNHSTFIECAKTDKVHCLLQPRSQVEVQGRLKPTLVTCFMHMFQPSQVLICTDSR